VGRDVGVREGFVRPVERYGPDHRLPRPVVVAVLAFLFAGLLGVTAWYAGHYARPDVRVVPGRTDFSVLGDDRVEITWTIDRRDGAADVVCVVRSRGADGSEVGRDQVRVAGRADGERITRTSYVLRTTARAVTGEVPDCVPVG
jgi:hypothetical protein